MSRDELFQFVANSKRIKRVLPACWPFQERPRLYDVSSNREEVKTEDSAILRLLHAVTPLLLLFLESYETKQEKADPKSCLAERPTVFSTGQRATQSLPAAHLSRILHSMGNREGTRFRAL
jgi:hypothetical protein